MFTMLYKFSVGYDGQKAHGQKTFTSESDAIDAAVRMQSNPGFFEVQVWCGATRIY